MIVSPYSRRNRDGALADALTARDAPLWAEPRSPEALVEALEAFHDQGVEVIAVSGGDGTLRDVLTALPNAESDVWPDIALLPAGKTDLAARIVGHGGRGIAGVRRLRAAARNGTLTRTEWPVLEISWPDAPERRIRGLLFGAAGFAAGIRIGSRDVHGAGVHDTAAVALSIAATVAATLFGRHGRDLRNGEDMGVGVDDAPSRGGRHFLTLATTLDRLVLGLTPFWGEESGKPIRWLDIPAPPERLMAALWPVLRGRPRPWMIDAGYASGQADLLRIETRHPFVVDGELFDPGPRGILLSAAQRVGFVAP